jgi:AcrR family transcriptional regulator
MKKAKAPAARGRPRSFDRQEALCAALRVFREQGYEGTSIADLQRALGDLSPPSIYAAFGSKEELFKEAVELYRNHVRAVTERATAAAKDTKAAVDAWLRTAVATFTETGEPRGCLIVQGALACSPADEGVQHYLRATRREAQRALAAQLERGVAAGDVPADANVGTIAAFYSAFIHGLAIQARDGASRASLLAAVDYAMLAWDAFVRS